MPDYPLEVIYTLQVLRVEELGVESGQLPTDGEEEGSGVTRAQEITAIAADEVARPLGMDGSQMRHQSRLPYARPAGDNDEPAVLLVEQGLHLSH